MKNSFSTRLSLYVIGSTSLLFIIAFSAYSNYTSNILLDEVLKQQNSNIQNLTQNINERLSLTEMSVKSSLNSIYSRMEHSQDFEDILKNTVKSNPQIYGAAVALEPSYFNDSKEHFFMQYAKLDSDGSCSVKNIKASSDYVYKSMDWYNTSKHSGTGNWSEPYFDNGAGNIAMTTYCEPLYDKSGKFMGVATADIALNRISEKLALYKPYEQSYTFLLSRKGYFLSHKNADKILNKTFLEFANIQENKSLEEIGRDMIAQKRGSREFIYNGKDLQYAFYAPINRTGWSACTVSYNRYIFKDMEAVNRNFWITISVALLLMLVFTILVIRRSVRPLVEFAKSAGVISKGNFDAELPSIKNKDEMYRLREAFVNMQLSLKDYIKELKISTKQQERIESELSIATDIQMGMLPCTFPPFENLPNLELYASLIPAKEVGGDLYDFVIDGNMFYFTVGDASGKGVPASLLMAVTSSIFRSEALHLQDPGLILKSMNNSISEKNDACMFITLFVGALNTKSGELKYASAGHNAPVLARGGKSHFMEVSPNLPLGVMSEIEFESHSEIITSEDIIFVYSDGVTEAENPTEEQYSDERLLNTVASLSTTTISSNELVTKVLASVDSFADGAQQSDDITAMALRLTL